MDPDVLRKVFGVVSVSLVDHIALKDLESRARHPSSCDRDGEGKNLCDTHKAGRTTPIHLPGESDRLRQPDPKRVPGPQGEPGDP